MHSRNREILARVIEAFGNKEREQRQEARKVADKTARRAASPPQQLSLLGTQ
jgi:hypothetical protein